MSQKGVVGLRHLEFQEYVAFSACAQILPHTFSGILPIQLRELISLLCLLYYNHTLIMFRALLLLLHLILHSQINVYDLEMEREAYRYIVVLPLNLRTGISY